MRMLMVITDSEALPEFERGFLESGDRGFTVVPKVFGRGKTGLRAGDRVHPGGSSLLFSVVPDAEAEATLSFIKAIRDRARVGDVTKLFSIPAEDVS